MGGLFIKVNYIVVPIFLMLRDGDSWLKGLVGGGFLLNNIFVLAVVYAATALPFTIYLLSAISPRYRTIMKKPLILTAPATAARW